MNEIAEVEQKQIFESVLDNNELDVINSLVNKHKNNAAITQQLALDASKLVTTSQERLAKQSSAGFFKRIASTISGKSSENQLLNQKDILQIQRFSWHYLQQLQQQNLINAQSIAVIRNNLSTMNEYIIETRDFLEIVIDKFDNRLTHVENHARFNNWLLNVESNKRRYKSIPKILLILRLTYNFMQLNQGVQLSKNEVDNYLITTLEKLDINCDEEFSILGFISELIDQIDLVGVNQYREMIRLSFDEYVIEPDYIHENISGIGVSSLYFLSENYEKVISLIDDDAICTSDEARDRIISKLFYNELSDFSLKFSIRSFIYEVIGGCQLAIELFKDENGLNIVQEDVVEEIQDKEVKLVSSLPDIQRHTFLDSVNNDINKRNYITSLALCIDNSSSFNEVSTEFLTLLAEKIGYPELKLDILKLADNPRKFIEYQNIMPEFLDDDDKKYTWLFDAFFLLSLAQKPIESQSIKVVLTFLKPNLFKECLPNIRMIINDNDIGKVIESGSQLAKYTQGWMNIIQYRNFQFHKYFSEPIEQLNSASWAVTRLIIEGSSVYTKGMEHSVFFNFSDGSFLDNIRAKADAALCIQGRKSALASLNELREKAVSCISESISALSQANVLIARWNLPSLEFDNSIHYSNFDLDNSVDNEEWGEYFDRYFHQIENTLNKFSDVCGDAMKQLCLFSEGKFDQSVLKLKEQEQLVFLQQQEQEKQEKQSVTILADGKEHLFYIEWQQIENFPCDPELITEIKTDGKIWFAVVNSNSDEIFYRSEDGVNWRQVQIDTPDIKIWYKGVDVVNGMWIIKNDSLQEGTRDIGIYYSEDAITWRHCPAPELSKRNQSISNGHMFFEDIIYFNGYWLWCGHQYQKYNYTEKGFFSDTTKTDYYKQVIFYSAKTLEGPWRLSELMPKLSEGTEVNYICSLPGKNSLLAFCEYNSSYIRNKKKPETESFVMYYGTAKSWNKCDWIGTSYSYNKPLFINMNDRLVSFCSGDIFISDKGYEWKKQKVNLYIDQSFRVKDFNIFTCNNNSTIFLSQDAENFNELILDEGEWRCISAKDEAILAVYSANQHEKTVLRIGHYICKSKI